MWSMTKKSHDGLSKALTKKEKQSAGNDTPSQAKEITRKTVSLGILPT